MKSIIILGDGMSDHPVKALNGKTPLMVANKPHIDKIAKMGVTGRFVSIPDGQPNGSAVANLSVLGYDPEVCFQGRGVLEAASMQVNIGIDDVAMRCNLICIDKEGKIKNHSAGHISTEESTQLIEALDNELGSNTGEEPLKFYCGVSFRHLMVLKGDWASAKFDCAPPHDHVGEFEKDLMPRALDVSAQNTVKKLIAIHKAARKILSNHPVNLARIAQGKDPANSIWVWSPGKRPQMDTLKTLYNKTGAVISAVDLIQGLGVLAGMQKIIVEGATGLEDTNYEGKAAAALDAIEKYDVVYVHVEATDEAGHAKDLDLKIKCIEYLDHRLVKPILEGIEKRKIETTIAILPDHPTPVETGCHANDPVPVAIWSPNQKPDGVAGYDEEQVKKGSLGLLHKNEFFKKAIGFLS